MNNKTAIYLLATIMITVLAASVILPGITIVNGFVAGFKAGYENSEKLHDQGREVSMELVMTPTIEKYISTTDSITFDDGRKYPAVTTQYVIFTDGRQVPTWTRVIQIPLYALVFTLLIILIVYFIKFVVNIAKGRIFIEANARYLRYFSLCLIGIACLEIASGCIAESTLGQMNLRLAGYTVSALWSFPWSDLLIGLCSMLISIAWSRGIAIKEEQELTI